MELFIWYNPLNGSYEKGDKEAFQRVVATCKGICHVTMLYELNELSARLANKILSELNSARHQYDVISA